MDFQTLILFLNIFGITLNQVLYMASSTLKPM